jgi:hypothetical protein
MRVKYAMNKLVAKFGKLITASFFVMGIGIILFLLGIPLYAYFEIDTDIIGLMVFTVGLALLIIGVIRRKHLKGWKLVLLIILAVLLCLPVLSLIISLLYVLITGNPLGG